MKVLYCLCCFVCALLYNDAAQAYFSPILKDIPCKDITENQTFTEPKPLSSDSYVKYAAVSFISKKGISTTGAAQGDDLDTMPIKETSCPKGETKVNGICIDVSACKDAFQLTSASKSVGSYVTKDCGDGNRFCYTSCQTGWVKDGCKCTAVSCSGFPHDESSGHNCNGVKSCKTGDTYKYKCTSCQDGYTLSDGQCNSKVCTDHGKTYFSSLTEHCATYDVKRTGDKECFSCKTCNENDGWVIDKDTGRCVAKACSGSASQIANCTDYSSVYKSGDGYCYTCKTCADGYNLSNGACVAKTCGLNGGGKTYDIQGTTSTITGCKTYETIAPAGNKICRKCKTCAAGYAAGGGTACYALTCGTGEDAAIKGTTSAISNCKTYETVTPAGDSICRKCKTCAAGYTLNSTGTACEALTCGINSGSKTFNVQGTTSSITGCKTYETITQTGDSICRKCTSCAAGYAAGGGTACYALTCGTGTDAAIKGTTSAINNCAEYETIAPAGDNICRKCKTCAAGYKLNDTGTSCTAKTCGTSDSDDLKGTTGWNVSNCHEYTSIGIAGDKVCMKCTTCAGGYWKNSAGTACTKKTCGIGKDGNGRQYDVQGTKSKIANCKTYTTIASFGDGDICYKCSECALGYSLNSDGTSCTAKTCGIGSSYTVQGTSLNIDNCAVSGSITVTGTSYCQTCAKCSAGYVLNANKTECTASNSGSCPHAFAEGMGKLANCKTMATTKVAEKYCHTCTECESGYTKDGNGGCKQDTPANCAAIGNDWHDNHDNCASNYETKTSQAGSCYKCSACNTSYVVENGKCMPTYCGALNANAGNQTYIWGDSKDHCTSYDTTTIANNKTCYRCKSCASGYKLAGANCIVEKDSTGYACLQAGYGPLNTYCVNYDSCSGTRSTYYRCNQCSSQSGVAKRYVTERGVTMSFCGKTCTGGYDIGGSCLPESYYKNVIKDALTYIGYY